MRLEKPRVEPLPESERSEEAKKILDGLGSGGRNYNIFGTLARYPKLLQRWLVFGSHILSGSSLPARERELVILRVGWVCRAGYEWGHHASIGKKAGLSDEEIRRVAEGPSAAGWSAFEAAMLRGVDELLADTFLCDATWKSLTERFTTEQMMDYIFTVGQYKLVSMALNSMGVQLEEGYEKMPEM